MFEVVFSAEQRNEPGELCAVFPPAALVEGFMCRMYDLPVQPEETE